MDTGGTLVGGAGQEAGKDALLVRAMASMGYDALNSGREELQAGSEALRQLAEPSAPTLISSTVKAEQGQGQAAGAPKPYLIRQVSGVRVGLVGVTSSDPGGGNAGPSPADALRQLLPEVRRQADLIVALADLEPDGVQALAAAGLDLDVILGSRSASIQEAARQGRAIVASIGPDGQYVGRLSLVVDAGGKIASFKGEAVPLDDQFSADPDLLQLRNQYR